MSPDFPTILQKEWHTLKSTLATYLHITHQRRIFMNLHLFLIESDFSENDIHNQTPDNLEP